MERRVWKQFNLDPRLDRTTPEELAAMEEAYQEWSRELDAAIESGDEARIHEVWEMGK
jgi:hypothetical protein